MGRAPIGGSHNLRLLSLVFASEISEPNAIRWRPRFNLPQPSASRCSHAFYPGYWSILR